MGWKSEENYKLCVVILTINNEAKQKLKRIWKLLQIIVILSFVKDNYTKTCYTQIVIKIYVIKTVPQRKTEL